jgi:hypothetical protein
MYIHAHLKLNNIWTNHWEVTLKDRDKYEFAALHKKKIFITPAFKLRIKILTPAFRLGGSYNGFESGFSPND